MADPFRGRGWLVTGAASGIGLATARALGARGARLCLWDMNAGALEKAAAGLQAESAVVDVARPDEVRAAMDGASARLGGLHGVVHSAGILRTGLFEALPAEEHRRSVEVNLVGTMAVAHAALPHLRKARGSLVMLASSSAFYGPPEFASYGAAKAGVLSLAQSLRIETRGSGVHVAAVFPLFVSSPMMTGANAEARLFRRMGATHTPEEVAGAILRGVEARKPHIFPSFQPRLLFWLSRHSTVLFPRLMQKTWRR
jgi:NAD(P)-dependent dehydrogenase (short-subunit alcohol dehydrogenase family)